MADSLRSAACPSYSFELWTSGEPPTRNFHPSRLDRSAPIGSHFPAPLQCGPNTLYHYFHHSSGTGLPMTERPGCLGPSEIPARAPPAAAKRVDVFPLPYQGQSSLDLRWSGRLTRPDHPSFLGGDTNPVLSVCVARYWPFRTSTDHPGGRNGKEVFIWEHLSTPCPCRPHENPGGLAGLLTTNRAAPHWRNDIPLGNCRHELRRRTLCW